MFTSRGQKFVPQNITNLKNTTNGRSVKQNNVKCFPYFFSNHYKWKWTKYKIHNFICCLCWLVVNRKHRIHRSKQNDFIKLAGFWNVIFCSSFSRICLPVLVLSSAYFLQCEGAQHTSMYSIFGFSDFNIKWQKSI